MTVNNFESFTLNLASSRVSLIAPCSIVSPFSKKPAGKVQKPSLGSIDLLQSKTLHFLLRIIYTQPAHNHHQQQIKFSPYL